MVRVPEISTDLYLLQGIQRSLAVYPDYYLVGSMDGFLRRQSVWGLNLTTHFHPELRLIMNGAIPTFPRLFLWRVQGHLYGGNPDSYPTGPGFGSQTVGKFS